MSPRRSFRLKAGSIHELSVLEYGAQDGIPVVFLHGGPGASVSFNQIATFDLDTYRVVAFDQRGAGESTPAAELAENTTDHLIADIEAIREGLGIDQWLVAGGSWGSCLALAYGQAHPERCVGFRLHGIFLGGHEDIDWWFHGAKVIFPDHWEEFAAFVPEAERGDLLKAYYRRLTSGDAALEAAAAKSLRGFSARTQTLEPDPTHVERLLEPKAALAVARIFTHYCIHGAFLEPGQLLRDLDRIRHLPAEIVQGRYDTVTPMASAWKLKRAWPEAAFTVVTLANHHSTTGLLFHELCAASRRLSIRLAARHSESVTHA